MKATMQSFVVLVLFAFFRNSQAINCYQCSGTDSNPKTQFQCNEWLDGDANIEPESCDHLHGAKYCVKHTGRFEAQAIKCFQCYAGENIDCADGMIHMGGLVPESCDNVFEAQYCIKSTGFAGGVGTKRFCSSVDMGNYCNYVKQPGDKLENYRTCIFTCTGDGCNSAGSLTPTRILSITAIFTYLFWQIR